MVVVLQPREVVGGIRKIAPLLESSLLPKEFDRVSKESTEWKAVPDIWKTTAEKYGDLVALSDPHRKPPVEVTYKQVCTNHSSAQLSSARLTSPHFISPRLASPRNNPSHTTPSFIVRSVAVEGKARKALPTAPLLGVVCTMLIRIEAN